MQTPISSSKFRAGGDADDDEDHVVCCDSFLFFNETGETKNTGKSTASSRKSLDRKAKPATRNESCFTISVHVVAFTIMERNIIEACMCMSVEHTSKHWACALTTALTSK